MSSSWPHVSHREFSSSYPASLRRCFVQTALTAALRSDDDPLREILPLLLLATRLATSSEALEPMKPEDASFSAASLWSALRTAAHRKDSNKASEVVVSKNSVLFSSMNWKGEGQVHPKRSRLKNAAPTGPFTLRQQPERCVLPRSNILRRAGRLKSLKNWPCSPASCRGCVAESKTSLAHLRIGAMSEGVVGSTYQSQRAGRDLPAVSGL